MHTARVFFLNIIHCLYFKGYTYKKYDVLETGYVPIII